MSIHDVLFFGYATLTLAAAAGVVLATRLVHAVMWLFVSMIALAGLYLILGSELLAGVQLFVYGGAVTILALFALILARPTAEMTTGFGTASTWIAGIGAAVLLAALGAVTARTDTLAALPGAPPQTAEIALELFTRYVVLFEVAGLLLTVALIGGVVLARADGDAT